MKTLSAVFSLITMLACMLMATGARAQSLSVSIRVGSVLTPSAGFISPTNWFSVTHQPQSFILSANNSNPAYVFDSWVMGNANVTLDTDYDQTTNDDTIIVKVLSTNTNTFVKAMYRSAGNSLVINANPPTGGTTDPGVGTNWVPALSSILVSASPNDNYDFTGWSGALVGSVNPQTLYMNANKVVAANFIRTWTVSQSYYAGPSVPGPDTSIRVRNGSNLTVNAYAPWVGPFGNNRYRCNGYTNGVNINPKSNMGGGVYTAVISPITNDVSFQWSWVKEWTVHVPTTSNGTALVTDLGPGDGDPNDGWFDDGTPVVITMIPNNPSLMQPDYCLVGTNKMLPDPNGNIYGVVSNSLVIQPFFIAKSSTVLPSWFMSMWGMVSGTTGSGPNDDPDHDGLSNIQEAMLSNTNHGWYFNPLNADTDGDGIDDGYEVNAIDITTNLTDQALQNYRRAGTDDGSFNPDNGPNGNPDGDYHWSTSINDNYPGYEDRTRPLTNLEEYRGPDGKGPIFTNLNFGQTICGIIYPFPDNPAGSRPAVRIMISNPLYTGDTGDQSKGNVTDTDRDEIDDGYEWSWDKWQQANSGSNEVMEIGVTNGVAIMLTNTIPIWDGSNNITRRFNPGLNQSTSVSGLASGQSDNDVLYDYTSGGVSRYWYTDLMEYNASSTGMFNVGIAGAPHSLKMDNPPGANPRRSTHPFLMDVDKDGLPDGYEVIFGYDPWNAHTSSSNISDDNDNPDNDWMARISTNRLSLRNHEVYMSRAFDCRVAIGKNVSMGNGDIVVAPTTLPYNNLEEMRGPDGIMALHPRGAGSDLDDATNPRNHDSDGDGIWDGWENYTGMNPNDPGDAAFDADKDNLSNLDEFRSLNTSSTNIAALTPLPEWMNKLFPTDPGVAPSGFNADWTVEPWTQLGADTDGDGIKDGDEKAFFNRNAIGSTTNVTMDDLGNVVTNISWVGTWGGKCYDGGGLNPCTSDTDGDTLPDPYEASYSTALNGTVGDQFDDPDHDKLANYQEYYSAANWLYQYDVWGVHPRNTFYDPSDFFTGTPLIFDTSKRNYIPLKKIQVGAAILVRGPSRYSYVGANPSVVDTDSDGMDDYYEIFHMLNPAYGIVDVLASRDSGSVQLVGPPNGPYVADPRVAPWVNGTLYMDSDGDGLPNTKESINLGTPAVSPYYHTDPSPLWMSDWDYPNSWVNEYYTVGPIWYWALVPPVYAYDFECNEGFDTDGDGYADQEELVTTQTDPQSPEHPMKRRALYLPDGVKAYARTLPLTSSVTEALRSYTVEAWIRPSNPASGNNQVVVERPCWVHQGNPMNLGEGVRVNFRLGLDSAGIPYVGYTGDGKQPIYHEAKASSSSRVSTSGWTHLCGTYQVPSPTDPLKRGTLTLYVNGQMAKQTNPDELPCIGQFSANGTTTTVPTPILVGASDNNPNGVIRLLYPPDPGNQPAPTNFFKGWVDEIRIWNGVRSPSQINTGMSQRMRQSDVFANQTSTAPLFYLYTFDSLADPDHSPSAPASVGFDTVSSAIDPSDWGACWFWGSSPEHSTVYTDYRFVPWIQNAVEHVPVVYPTDIGDPNGRVAILNGTNIIGYTTQYRNTWNNYGWWHQSFPDFGTESTVGFHNMFDLLPLGASVADEDIPMWDGGGTPALDPFSSLGDGIPDAWKEQYGFDPLDPTVATADPDGDGLNNYYEYLCGTDPKAAVSPGSSLPDAERDADGDGLSNIREIQLGTMPNMKDTDDDGLTDWEEVTGQVDPTWVRPANSPIPKAQTDPLNPLSPAFQRSAYLNGLSRLIVPPSDKLLSKNWTVESWVNPDTNSVGGVIASRYVQGYSSDYGINYEIGLTTNLAPAGMFRAYTRYLLATNGGVMEARVDGLGSGENTSGLHTVLIPTGTWSHVAGVCDSTSNTMSLYVNGHLASYRTDMIALPPTEFGYGTGHHDDEVTIGASRSTGTVSNGFKGYLDNVRIWSTARTGSNILDRYDAPEGVPSGSVSSPLAEFRFDDGGTSAQDFSISNDWINGWSSAAKLDGAAFSTNTMAPLNKDSDGDGLPDWWEMANSLDPHDATGVNGAYGDPDGDGLNNMGEYRAGTDPHRWSTAGTAFSDYDSRQGPGFRTYGELYDDGDGIPDLWEILYRGSCLKTGNRGLDPAYYDANLDPDQDGWGNYAEYMSGTDPLLATSVPSPAVTIRARYHGKWGNSLENTMATNTAVGQLKLSFYRTAAMDGWPIATLAMKTSQLTTTTFDTGNLVEGDNYVFAYLDLNNNNQFDPDSEPAGIGQFQPYNVEWGTVDNLEVGLTDALPGYPRFSWPANPHATRYIVTYVNGSTVINRAVQGPRNYFHEGDYLYSGLLGLPPDPAPTFTIYQDVVPDGYMTFVTAKAVPPVSLATPAIVTPNGSMQFVYARNDLQFRLDPNATAYRLQIAAASNGVPLSTSAGIIPYTDIDGSQKVTLPFYAGDNFVPPAGGYAVSNWVNGLYWARVQGSTPAVTSSYSPWSSFMLNVQPPFAGGQSMISGDIHYFGKVSHGYGAGQNSNLTIVVQAFRSPGFSGTPDAQVQVSYQCITNAPSALKGSYGLMGLHGVPYYVRAFIDVNGNRRLDPWEPVGFSQIANSNGYQAAMVDLSGGNASRTDIKVVIRDRDTDDDGLPDGWEYMYYGTLGIMASNVGTNGLTLLRNYEIEPADLDPTRTDYDNDGVPDQIEIDWTDAMAGVAANPGHGYVAVNWTNLHTFGNHVYNPYDPVSNPSGTDLNPSKWDTDGDGLSDGWEITHGWNPLNPSDGPVQMARARAAGITIPGIPSVSQVAVVTPSGGQFSLTWQGQIGMSYEVQYSDDLKTWQTAGGSPYRYGPIMHTYIDNSPKVNIRFYRVVVK